MIKKILIPIYLGFILFSILSFFKGPVGIENSRKLGNFKEGMVKHVDDLKLQTLKLEDEINLLQSSSDRLKVLVRPLGLYEPGDKVVKIINYDVIDPLYKINKQYDIPIFSKINGDLALISTIVTIILFLLILLVGVVRDTLKRK